VLLDSVRGGECEILGGLITEYHDAA